MHFTFFLRIHLSQIIFEVRVFKGQNIIDIPVSSDDRAFIKVTIFTVDFQPYFSIESKILRFYVKIKAWNSKRKYFQVCLIHFWSPFFCTY